MSVVSAKIDAFKIGRMKHVAIPVQYQKNDSGEPEPADFSQPPQLPFFNISKKIRIPAVNLMPPPPRDFVPLKCDQVGSRPFGSALFDADTPAWTAPLDIESDIPYPVKAFDYSLITKFPDAPAPFPYDAGIRGGRFPIKIDKVSEPTADVYRKGVREHNYTPSAINYDMGVDELRAMAKRMR